jgi:hypothetical protein
MIFADQDIIALTTLTDHQKMLEKKFTTVMYMKDCFDNKQKFDSLDVQKLLLRKIIMINDILQNILNVYYYTIYSIIFLYHFISISLLT